MIGTNIGIDLGTTRTVIYREDKGIVVNEPTAVAYDSDGRIVGIGNDAEIMKEKAPENIKVVFPMENGVISDFFAAKHILQYFITNVCKNMVFRPNVVVSVPSVTTGLEKKTVLELAASAGAAKACVIEEPLAASLGAGIQNDHPKGTMIVDIGGGTTDVAVITMGNTAVSKSVRAAGKAMDEAIIRYLRRERDIVIGSKTAEEIKIKIGSATLRDIDLGMIVKGKSYLTKLPALYEITSKEVFLAIRPVLETILKTITEVLQETTPELAGDILESGIYLTGGGALLHCLDKMIENKLNIKAKIPAEPDCCVALGTGIALEKLDILRNNGDIFISRQQMNFDSNAENDE